MTNSSDPAADRQAARLQNAASENAASENTAPKHAAPGNASTVASMVGRDALRGSPQPPIHDTYVVATFNRHKAAELHALLALPGITLVALGEQPGAVSPEESGTTLLANSLIKARYAARLTGLPAIADDTGLEVDALGGEPGVFAARYAGPGATYADNVAKLLRELAGVPITQRSARFRTACVAVWPDGRELHAEGVLEGLIIDSPRGTNGFGYDPVFVPAGDTRTFAELTSAEKHANSHRARAVKALAGMLRSGRIG